LKLKRFLPQKLKEFSLKLILKISFYTSIY
jgi:hypothetical protein